MQTGESRCCCTLGAALIHDLEQRGVIIDHQGQPEVGMQLVDQTIDRHVKAGVYGEGWCGGAVESADRFISGMLIGMDHHDP